METRALLAVLISLLVIMVFHYWFASYYAPPPESTNQTVTAESPSPKSQPTQKILRKEIPAGVDLSRVREIQVENDFLRLLLTEAGVRFKSFELKNYKRTLKDPDPIQMVSAPKKGLPIEIYLASRPETGILPYRGPQKTHFRLKPEEPLEMRFVPEYSGELLLDKTLVFKGHSYLFDLFIRVRNTGKESVKDRVLLRLVAAPFSDGTRYVFKGPAYFDGQHLEEVKLKKDLREYAGPLKWVGYEDAYFLAALLPQEELKWRVTFRKLDEKVDEVILWTPEFELPPGGEKTFRFSAYFGPKKMEILKEIGRGLPEALHFGFFDPVAKPLLWCLKFFHRYVGNYGLAIILLTVLIRILFWPLNHLSYKSMKKMQEIQPLIQKIREKYKDDPQRLNQELMHLYRTYKINPFSGCLPILIQIPVFFALYKVLLQAIELRHAPFFGWIQDLSAPDRLPVGFDIPYLGGLPVLTILMGLSMYFQQKLSPTSLDPTQAKIMLFMPLFFTVLFVNFPSGLVLYWLVNNVLSIAQQVATNKILHAR